MGRCSKVCGGRFPRIGGLPLEGKMPIGADRAQAAGKTDAESGTARHMWKKRKSLAANDKDFSLCSK